MSTRISSALLLLVALAACDMLRDKPAEEAIKANKQAYREADGRIDCSIAGEAFASACTVDIHKTQDGTFLTLRHPDGGFRRLRVTTDGSGVIAADGAEPALVKTIDKDRIEVALGPVRYRLPATVGPLKK